MEQAVGGSCPAFSLDCKWRHARRDGGLIARQWVIISQLSDCCPQTVFRPPKHRGTEHRGTQCGTQKGSQQLVWHPFFWVSQETERRLQLIETRSELTCCPSV